MKTTANVLIMLFRLLWLVSLALGIWIWTGHGYATLHTHILLGLALTILLAALTVLAVIARDKLASILMAIVWIVLLPVIGFGQLKWLPGPSHVVLRVAHLLMGLFAIASAEMLAARAKRT